MSGTLLLPKGEGPFPAFILLHGSGPETRSAFTAKRYVRRFVAHGISVLHYDKRGAGKSSGDWMASDYYDLARDAAAGIALLARRDDIDSQAIGIIGFSEGGWTGPLAATLSEHAALLITVSGPPMSPREQGAFELEVELRGRGASPDAISEAVALYHKRWNVLKSDEGWDELDQAIAAARTTSWYELAGRPERLDPANRRSQWYARVMDYDPVPALKSLEIPALMLYGAADPVVDAKRSSNVIRELVDTEKKSFTVHIYPNVGHNLTTNGFSFPSDHWDRIFSWIAGQSPKQ
ncbi:MAG: alpha/beta hydrolase [Candidatus Hydrogenedentes bacterium]|nr:alpha/beta hydrolase [Candidatus Hydrogenedentota bacterium]